MIGDFNIDGGVVGEQAHFIGVNFVLVFSRQLCSKNDATLPRAGNEDSRLGKGGKDMLAFIAIHRKFQTRRVVEDSTRLYGETTQHSMRLSVDGYILQTAVQSAAQYIFHTLNNKIDDFHHRAYSDMSLRYFGDVACPVFPMGTDDFGIETRSISPILNGNAVCSSGL